MAEEFDEFDWQFHVGEDTDIDDELQSKAERRMRALAKGHNDMIGASVAVERPARRESAFVYEARIVAYVRPNNVVADRQGESAEAALNDALDAIERQVREHREELRKPWQRPHRREPPPL